MLITIALARYSPAWPELFARERATIRAALHERALAVEHIGSTAVYGLTAKPIIDILLAVPDLADTQALDRALRRVGYAYSARAQFTESRFYEKGPWHRDRYHLHTTELGSTFWQEKLLFRDYLRTHPATADDYCALKRELARCHPTDRTAYSAAKSEFVCEVVARARREHRQDQRQAGTASLQSVHDVP